MSEFVSVGDKKGFRAQWTTGVNVQGQRICIARIKDEFFAFDDQCTHAEAALENVEIDGEEIDCPLHGAKFSVKSGQALTLPAVKPIRTHEIKVEGETLFVKLNEQRLIEE
jgi:3-phenylpropionate/trans-cinnamate dioxygenase ferredoxin subunit